jgi:isopenicillin-N epimerase
MLKDLFLLDPSVIFLNHGSFGACPRPVFDVYQDWQRQLEQQPVQFLGRELDEYLFQSRQELGKYIHADADDLVYLPNATHGVNIVARSLSLQPGDEILTTDHEYGACNFIWEFICHKTGAIYIQQPISLPIKSWEEVVEQLWKGVTPRTKVIFISHITSPTALTLPIETICQRARQAGILTLIDGAHAPGQIDLDMDSINADFYTGNCHKWMLCPKGVGFLYTRREVQNLIEPLIVSWGYKPNETASNRSKYVNSLQWTGTRDPSAALSVPAAIRFMEEHNWEEVRIDSHKLLGRAIEQICRLSGMTSLFPIGSNFYHQMGIAPLPRIRDLNELKNRLYENDQIEIPCIEWNSRHFLRISVQGYNTEEDINSLINALKLLLPQLAV